MTSLPGRLTPICLAAAALLLPAAGAAALEPGGPSSAARAVASGSPQDTGGPVVLIGVGGLDWSMVDAGTTPALWSLAGSPASVGNMSVRSLRGTACPVDGWLAVSAGRRAAEVAVRGPGDLVSPTGADCTTPGEAEGGRVPGWQGYVQAARNSDAGAEPGTFGAALAAAGVSTGAVGPGGAIALADKDGRVAGAVPAPQDPAELGRAVADLLQAGDRLVVVDAGSVLVRPGAPDVPAQARTLDARVGAVLEAARTGGSRILVAAIADDGTAPGLRLSAAEGTGLQGQVLGSTSTRTADIAQVTDLPTTVLALLGADRSTMPVPGALMGPSGTGAGTARIAALRDQAVHARAIRPVAGVFNGLWGLVVVLVVLGTVLLLAAERRDRREAGAAGGAGPADRADPADGSGAVGSNDTADGADSAGDTGLSRRASRRARWWGVVGPAGVWAAAWPASSYLANALPWWREGALAGVVLVVVTVLIAAGLAAGALAGGRLRAVAQRWGPLAPWGLVGALTVLVLAGDTVTGGHLGFCSPFGSGSNPLVGGRYYGLNNAQFALLATGAFVATVAAVGPWVRAGRRGRAAAVCAVVGLVTTVVDAAPQLGADFGGAPAIVPAFALMALWAGGVRVTWRRALAVLVAGVVAVAGVAAADWARGPESWTHLGAFAQSVLDGTAWQVIGRKLTMSRTIALVGLPVVAVAGALAWAAARVLRGSPRLETLNSSCPVLGPGLIALTVLLVIGSAVNDSGISILVAGAALAAPGLATALALAPRRPGS